MISIGNDIVALNSVNKQRTNDTRFHSKFITPAELALYQSPSIAKIPFESFVWLLWSVKEAAYKYQKRLNPELVFSPGKVIVHQIAIPQQLLNLFDGNVWEGTVSEHDLTHGYVSISGNTLYFKSIIQEELIASFVGDDPLFTGVYCGIRSITDPSHQNQSNFVRQFLITQLQISKPEARLTMDKAFGYPVLFENDQDTSTLISFAHHHEFITYCFKYKQV